MPYYTCFFLFTVFSIIILLIRSLIQSKQDIPVELFIEALRNENNGDYEDAVTTYESALDKFKKIRSHSYLKDKIGEKLKVLHTVIECRKAGIFNAGQIK